VLVGSANCLKVVERQKQSRHYRHVLRDKFASIRNVLARKKKILAYFLPNHIFSPGLGGLGYHETEHQFRKIPISY